MRRICLFSALVSLVCSVSFGQGIDLVVNQSQSSAQFTINGESDSSSVSGTGVINLTPANEPFSSARLTSLELTLADGFEISFALGFVTISSAPNSVMISLTNPGPAGTVNGSNQFDQINNFISMNGIVEIADPLGLAGGSAIIDLADVGLVGVDFNGVELSVTGLDLTVSAELVLNLDANGTPVDVVGNVVATGVLPDPFLLGDVNLDGVVDLLDVGPFVELLTSGQFQTEADINQDGIVSLLDVQPFVELLSGG